VSRKRKQRKPAVEAVPEDILAEGSGPVARVDTSAIATVEDVVTTDDIATTEDVVTADDVVATTTGPADEPGGSDTPASAAGDDASSTEEPSAPASRTPRRAARRAARAVAAEATDAADVVVAEVDAEVDEEAVRADGEGNGHGNGHGDGDGNGHSDGDGIDEAGEGEGDGEGDDVVVVFPTSAASMDAVQLKYLVEALIFASDRPLTVQRLRQLTRVSDVRRLEQALAELTEDHRDRGLVLQQVSGGYQFRTRTQFSAWVQQLIAGRPVRLSRAQLETLAIIAYRQPITRPEIDDIRGVDSTATLKLLIDRMLIRVLGKREEVGRPMLYGTTKEFLDFFSLGDLRELPTLREYSELTAESRKVMSDRLGIGPDMPDPDGGDGGPDGSGSGGGPDGDGGGGDGGLGGGPGDDGGSMPGGGGGLADDGGPMSSFDGADLADGSGPTPSGGGDSVPGDPDAMLGFARGGLADENSPARASADEVSAAVAAFWAAADAVERSNTAAVTEVEDPDDRNEPVAE